VQTVLLTLLFSILPGFTSALVSRATIHPIFSRVCDWGSDLQAIRHTLQARFLDLAIGNELPRSPSSWCLVMQIVIRGTWILPKCHPCTDVASSNASIFFPYHGRWHPLWRIELPISLASENLQSQAKNDFV
jgi:hypothetical protein